MGVAHGDFDRLNSPYEHNWAESARGDASPSRRIYRTCRARYPWEVSFPIVSGKLDNFCATYSYLSSLWRMGLLTK
jgi:hypothetical protein